MSPERFTDYLKRFDSFKDLPDLPDELDAEDVPSVTCRSGRAVTASPRRGVTRYERYLGDKWQCSETMPEGFNPDKLERQRQALLRASTTRKEPQSSEGRSSEAEDKPTAMDSPNPLSVPLPTYQNSSTESVMSITESLDPDELLGGYESRMTLNEAQAEHISHERPRANAMSSSLDAPAGGPAADPVERRPTPRIRTGSKPPLSKSAYANCADADCGAGGTRARSGSVSRPRAPKYFPFRSQMLSSRK